MLKFLISKLKTIDGTRDTALSVENYLYELKLKEAKKLQLQDAKTDKKIGPQRDLEEWRKKLIMENVAHLVMRKTYIKYLVLRIRQKISFHAYLKHQTI